MIVWGAQLRVQFVPWRVRTLQLALVTDVCEIHKESCQSWGDDIYISAYIQSQKTSLQRSVGKETVNLNKWPVQTWGTKKGRDQFSGPKGQ